MPPLECRIASLLTPTRQEARLPLADQQGDVVMIVPRRLSRGDGERVKRMVDMLVEGDERG